MAIIRTLGKAILDIIFPIECLGCKKEGEWVCGKCTGRIPLETQEQCFICQQAAPGGRTCFACQREFPLARVMRFFNYDEPLVRRAIHTAKYNFVPEALRKITTQALPHLPALLESEDIDPRALIFMPVPLHPRRLRMRGFNQAELVGRAFASACGAQFCAPLARTRFTLPQVDLDEEDRAANLKRAFECIDRAMVAGKYCVLTDDVATTGSTLKACGGVLKEAGAAQVWGLVLAKG